ncbi:MAG: glycosyltransferase family 9 protein [Nitrospirae bacterium]|nr:glycosyltransferase family 9 protein [Nitrospirota bacterium]MBI3593548.1 glycosyltransferase family 9 protein [Nitrospirota bacterium]
MILNLDCVYYRGDKPCVKKRLCEGCTDYQPMGTRILILKHAAMGDVLRTTPLLHILKREYPHSFITWLTDPPSADLLKYNKLIDRLYIYDSPDLARLSIESFDLLLSLDKEPRTAALAMKINAREKRGIGLSREGNVFPLNSEAEYYFTLGLSDELKFFKNKRSYQDLVCEAVGFKYGQEPYILEIPESARVRAKETYEMLGLRKEVCLIGLNTGAGGIFANKNWTPDYYVELINRLSRQDRVQFILFGGERERELNKFIQSKSNQKVYHPGDFPLLEFCALMERCQMIVTGDTLGMHIAIGLKVKLLVLFGPTCSQEIDLYGLGEKIVTTIGCAPCYKQICPETTTCMDLIALESVIQSMRRILGPSFVESV